MAESSAVNIAGRDLGVDDVSVGHRKWSAVIGESPDGRQVAGVVAIENHHLASAQGRVLPIGWGFSIHPQIPAGLLYQAVGLTGHDIGVFRRTDIQGLAAAP